MKYGAFIIGCSDCNEEVCAAGGRISTQSGTALEIFEKSHDKEKNRKLISKVTASGHTSTIEHIFFNLAFENVSVVVEQFMIEFRLASFTVKSRRYVDFSDCGYYVPEFESPEDKEKYTDTMDKMFSAYCSLTQAGVPKEDARFVLPYCFYSNFICSLGGRELVNVLTAMLYGRGSKIKEIYEIGLSLLNQCREYAPGVFTDFEARAEKYNDSLTYDFPSTGYKKSSELTEILTTTPDGDKIVAECALIEAGCYNSDDIESILSKDENIEAILRTVAVSSRPRVLESYSCTVKFNGVSLACLTHFARHRMQSICIPNLIRASREEYIIPDTVREKPELLEIYENAFAQMKELYNSLSEKNTKDSALIYCVLSGNVLDFVTTVNARELMLFFRLRCCTRAQWEIQLYANDLLRKLRKKEPSIFRLMGPSCYVKGSCPEGKMTCGRAAEIKKLFSQE